MRTGAKDIGFVSGLGEVELEGELVRVRFEGEVVALRVAEVYSSKRDLEHAEQVGVVVLGNLLASASHINYRKKE